VTAGPVTASDTVFYVPVANRNEYFLLENRQPLESDSALLNPARPGGKSPGLLIWHIDNDRVEANGFRTTNTVNTGRVQGVALMQADGRNDLRTPGTQNRGDAGDPYPGSTANQKFSWLSTPRTEDNAGTFAGFMVDQIAQVSARGPIRFRFTRRALSVMTAAVPGVQVLVNGALYTSYE
jgi:immune inhibitor A